MKHKLVYAVPGSAYEGMSEEDLVKAYDKLTEEYDTNLFSLDSEDGISIPDLEIVQIIGLNDHQAYAPRQISEFYKSHGWHTWVQGDLPEQTVTVNPLPESRLEKPLELISPITLMIIANDSVGYIIDKVNF